MANIKSELTQVVRHPGRLLLPVVYVYNKVLQFFLSSKPVVSNSAYVNEIIQHSLEKNTDISDHLMTLFAEAISVQPKLIVELGVRGGESTFVFERVSRLMGAKLVSVDIEDCSTSSSFKDWTFVQQDDVQFAKNFKSWCEARNITPQIDLLFIDTSHLYDHTVEEIKYWFPLLADQCRVIFHDTNMRKIYKRKDGSLGAAWANDRAVIRAIENYFEKPFNEHQDFVDLHKNWLIKHYAYSSGLTVLEKVQMES
jgi:cephalosporin hydroxylase